MSNWQVIQNGDDAWLANGPANVASHAEMKSIVNAIQSTYRKWCPRAIKTLNAEALEALYSPRDTSDEPKSTAGFVYLLSGSIYHKIGHSKNPPRRAESISTKMPWPVNLVWQCEVDDMFAAERALHELFDACRVHGEWFQISPIERNFLKTLTPEIEFGLEKLRLLYAEYIHLLPARPLPNDYRS